MDPDGTNKKQLTNGLKGKAIGPSISPDGRYIVFSCLEPEKKGIWRMDSEGGNLTQLTSSDDFAPVFTPDGEWVVFHRSPNGIWKIRVSGGEGVQVTQRDSIAPRISRDGRFLVSFDDTQRKILINALEGGDLIKEISVSRTTPPILVWSRDSGSILYIDNRGAGNIWSQPLDGGPAKQVTDFKSDSIYGFDLSYDGSQFVFARGFQGQNVVLLSDVK
jgi:Tol biopolymer transport system component